MNILTTRRRRRGTTYWTALLSAESFRMTYQEEGGGGYINGSGDTDRGGGCSSGPPPIPPIGRLATIAIVDIMTATKTGTTYGGRILTGIIIHPSILTRLCPYCPGTLYMRRTQTLPSA